MLYENLEDFNLPKKRKVLIVFDDRIADIDANKKFGPIVIELFLTGRKTSLVFVSQSYFKVTKTISLNATHYFIKKISNKRAFWKIALNHSFDIEFKDFVKLYKDYTKEPFSLLANNTTLPSDNPLRFKNLDQNLW